MASSISGRGNLVREQRVLKEHISELSTNMELINAHCFAVDNLTAQCERTVDEQFDKMIDKIEQTRKQSKRQLHASSKAQLKMARHSFINMLNERRLCEDLNTEIEKVMTIEDRRDESPHTERIKKLCKEIKRTCSKRASYDMTKVNGPNIKRKLIDLTKSNLNQMIKSFSIAIRSVKAKPVKGTTVNSLNSTNPKVKVIDIQNTKQSTSKYNEREQKDEEQDHERTQPNIVVHRVYRRRMVSHRNRGDFIAVSGQQMAWRTKQLQIGRESQEYRDLLKLYPGYSMDSKQSIVNAKGLNYDFVYPPKIGDQVSKRKWTRRYKKWRGFLHQITTSGPITSEK